MGSESEDGILQELLSEGGSLSSGCRTDEMQGTCLPTPRLRNEMSTGFWHNPEPGQEPLMLTGEMLRMTCGTVSSEKGE